MDGSGVSTSPAFPPVPGMTAGGLPFASCLAKGGVPGIAGRQPANHARLCSQADTDRPRAWVNSFSAGSRHDGRGHTQPNGHHNAHLAESVNSSDVGQRIFRPLPYRQEKDDTESDLECRRTEPTPKDLWKTWKAASEEKMTRKRLLEKKLRRRSEKCLS